MKIFITAATIDEVEKVAASLAKQLGGRLRSMNRRSEFTLVRDKIATATFILVPDGFIVRSQSHTDTTSLASEQILCRINVRDVSSTTRNIIAKLPVSFWKNWRGYKRGD